jgi:hypothetical protein
MYLNLKGAIFIQIIWDARGNRATVARATEVRLNLEAIASVKDAQNRHLPMCHRRSQKQNLIEALGKH